jgi:hypothetical protein
MGKIKVHGGGSGREMMKKYYGGSQSVGHVWTHNDENKEKDSAGSTAQHDTNSSAPNQTKPCYDFEVFTTVKIIFIVFWVIAPWAEDEGNTVLKNAGVQPPHYMAQQPRKPRILSHTNIVVTSTTGGDKAYNIWDLSVSLWLKELRTTDI